MIAAVPENPFQRCFVFEQGSAAGDVRGQPAVFVVGRNLFAQQPPGHVGTDAEALRLEKLECLRGEQILDGENLCDIGLHLVQLECGAGAQAQVIFLQA